MSPIAKKQKVDENASIEKIVVGTIVPTTLTPVKEYFKRLENAVKENGCKGSVIVSGVAEDEEEEEEGVLIPIHIRTKKSAECGMC